MDSLQAAKPKVKSVELETKLSNLAVDQAVSDDEGHVADVECFEAATSVGRTVAGEIPKKMKKKRKGGKKSKAKKVIPSGFEDNYAEMPMTPKEAEEDSEAYANARSFAQRIETCIQRFRAKRKWTPQRQNIFDKYLAYGGIDSTPRAFNGGFDEMVAEDMTTAEITITRAQDFINTSGNKKFYSLAEDEHWVVDFAGVVKGFLTHRAPQIFDMLNEDTVKEVTRVIRNFLNYVTLHQACPEYGDDILEALKYCALAEEELVSIARLDRINPELPGPFNTAASTLFGGHHYQERMAAGFPQRELSEEQIEERDQKTKIFKAVVGLLGSEDQYHHILREPLEVTTKVTGAFEVVDIELPDQEIVKHFKSVRVNDYDGQHSLIPVGKLIVKLWHDPSAPPEDLSDSEDEVDIASTQSTTVLWLEEPLLRGCFRGMHFCGTVFTLGCGINFIDNFGIFKCSFFTYLENDKMMEWKEPRLLDRPAPNVDTIENYEMDEDPEVV